MGAIRREWRPKDMTRAGSFYTLVKEKNNLLRIDKTKGFKVGIVKGENINRKVRVSLTRFVCANFLAPSSLSLVIKMSPKLLEWSHISHMGSLFLLSGRQKRVRVFFSCWLFLKCFYFKIINVTKVTYFEETFSEHFQWFSKHKQPRTPADGFQHVTLQCYLSYNPWERALN